MMLRLPHVFYDIMKLKIRDLVESNFVHCSHLFLGLDVEIVDGALGRLLYWLE